jgi:hypothetical protein
MTEKQLKQYEELLEVFQLRCEEICKILTPLNSSYKFLYDFEIEGGSVFGEGYEYWQYGGEERHSASFPKKFLCMSNSDIQKYVDSEVKRKEEEKLAREKMHQENLEKMERRQLEALKKKYGE